MDLLQIIVLAILQGLTEFLPISSSAHLILVPVITGWQDQGLAFDVAVHVGTLLAVVIYFRRDLVIIAYEWSRSFITRKSTGSSRLGWAVIFGSVPVGVAGMLVNDNYEQMLRSPVVIALASIVFGLLLWFSDTRGKKKYDVHNMGWKDIVFIGCSQVLALIPGASRSGITITAGLLLGLSRQASARFSFLLSIPVIFFAGVLKFRDLAVTGNHVDWQSLWLGAMLAGITAYLCIHLFLKLLDRIGMLPFVVYRVVLGVVLLWVFL